MGSLALLLLYQNEKIPWSQPETLLDEGFHGTAALVGSLAFFYFGTEEEGPVKTRSSSACHVRPLALKRLINFASIIWVYPFKHI